MSASPTATGSAGRAWFDLARAGNFPSVVSNVVAALTLGAAGWPGPAEAAAVVVGGLFLYAGGATWNDVFDADFDRKHRAERAIPRGVVSRRAAAWGGSLEMSLGAALLAWAGAGWGWLAALVATILAYDWLHKRWAGSVILMAGCRVWLALAVATRADERPSVEVLAWVGALAAYIVLLSVLARWEYRPGAPAARLGAAVGRLLAFIPAVDAAALLITGHPAAAMACLAAIPLGRWAQRLAAST